MKRRLFAISLVLVLIAIAGYAFVRQRQPQPIAYRPLRVGGMPSHTTSPAQQGVAARALPLRAEDLRASVKDANVVICVLDAARADHFGAYGYPRETTPNFDRLAKEAVVFDQHFTQYTQTSPSTATLFTGQYPDTHGVAVPRTGEDHEMLQGLAPDAFTLDWAMRSAGFRTLGFTSTPASAGVLRLGASFEVLFTPMGAVHSKEEDARWKSPEHLLALVRGNLAAGPRFFSYVHFLPPHEPYDAPQTLKDLYKGKQAPGYFEAAPAFTKVSGRFHDQDPPATGSDWVNLYDANLRYSDAALGELVSYLKQIGAYDNTLLIVTADHGEALGEHRYQWHATCPYDEALHIPLLMKFPKSRPAAGRVEALTETVDVMATLLDLLGIAAPPGTVQGASLVPLLTGARDKVHDYTFSRTNGEWPCYVVRNREWALLLYQGGRMRALYDLSADPRQTHNVINEHPEEANALAKAFAQFAETQPFRPLDFLDPSFKPVTSSGGLNMAIPEEARRKLRSLGYLE